MDASSRGKMFQQVQAPSVEFSCVVQSPESNENDASLIRKPDFSLRNEKTSGKDKKTGMAHPRCLPQIACFTLKRLLGYKLALWLCFATLILFILHEFDVPDFRLSMKMVDLDTDGKTSYMHSDNGMDDSRNGTVVRGQKRPPNTIIFGVSKCGTRAMLEYLKLHPNVVAASTEIDFFNDDSLYSRGPSWYLQQMPYSRVGQITVEKSPDYFQNPNCASRISQFNKHMKLILLLRDPVERLISQYMQLLDKNPKLPSFEEWAIDPNTGLVNSNVPSVQVSAYSIHLDSWFDAFPKHQILIVESQNLREKPYEVMKRVELFLNLNRYFEPSDFYFNETRGFYCLRHRTTQKTKCLGKTKGRLHIPVDSYIKHILRVYYEPFNSQLNDMLGYRLPWS